VLVRFDQSGKPIGRRPGIGIGKNKYLRTDIGVKYGFAKIFNLLAAAARLWRYYDLRFDRAARRLSDQVMDNGGCGIFLIVNDKDDLVIWIVEVKERLEIFAHSLVDSAAGDDDRRKRKICRSRLLYGLSKVPEI
jgi:hypothetical protein